VSVDVGKFYKSLCKRKKVRGIARSSKEREIVEKNSRVREFLSRLKLVT